jgi:diguanylate cyclase
MTKILVIEDMDTLREEIIETLSFEGFETLGAADGEIGVEIAKTYLPNLIICDIMMPKLDGYETLEALRGDPVTMTIPFIFLTAKAEKIDMRLGMELGADDYLTKPFTTEELVGAIAARLQKYQNVQAQHDATIQSVQAKHEVDIKQIEANYEYIAHHDPLTKLPNRLLFRQYLEAAVAHAQTNQSTLALMFVDIDDFNIINNSLGHNIGDLLFKAIAERLRRFVPPCDTVARLHGDELAIILLDDSELANLKLAAKTILEIIAKPYSIYGHQIFITACLGATFYPKDDQDTDGLIKNADMAMYYAKSQGRNTCKFYTSDLHARSSEQMAIENSLRRALDRGEFRLYYQPIVDLPSRQIVAAEALIRWQHPELGIVMPAKFIPIAESTGLILPLSAWIIRTACQQSQIWQSMGLPDISIAVNISGLHFKQDNFVDTLKEILLDMPHHNLEIEITENIVMQNTSDTIATLSALKAMGIQIAIDDFGTGYSSLSYLKSFPVDYLKIDKSFIQDVEIDPHDTAIIVAIIDLAHSLSLKVIAEGVETQAQLDFLEKNNCDRLQGYFFGVPLPVEQFEKLILPSC